MLHDAKQEAKGGNVAADIEMGIKRPNRDGA